MRLVFFSSIVQVGKLTHGEVTRSAYYEQAVALALIPFMNRDLYGEDYSWG